MNDSDLLRRYLDDRSEGAFREIVAQHIDIVYAAALRLVGGDAHLAKDVAQKVFVALARKAAALRDRPVLVGWLYTSTRLEAARVVRSERRWRSREQNAYAMNAILSDGAANSVEWEKLRPVLDDALAKLAEADRNAVLLRFFSGKSFAEVGQILQVSEEAARKRVDRALSKLQSVLGRKGIGSTSAVLGALLAHEAVAAAPAGILSAVTAGAWGELAAGAAASGAGLASFMTGSKIITGVASAVVALAIGSTVRDAFALRSATQSMAALARQTDEVSRQIDDLNRKTAIVDREIAPLQAAARAAAEKAAANASSRIAEEDLKRAQLSASRAGRRLQYARMFKLLELTPDKITALEAIMDKEQLGAGKTEDLGAELRQLLGDDGTKRYYDYKRSVSLHNMVDTVATYAFAGSAPFTGAQADQLYAILIANDANYQAGKGTDPSQVDWNAVWGPASKVLSEAQLNYFQATVEAQVLKSQIQSNLKAARSGANK